MPTESFTTGSKLLSSILRKYPTRSSRPVLRSGEGLYLDVEGIGRVLDLTSGFTGAAVLGYGHPDVKAALKTQIDRICHVSYGMWSDPQLEELAELLGQHAPSGLNKVYYAGLSGSEAVEAAMKLSFQVHHDSGKEEKSWIICRRGGYHGVTAHAMAVSDNHLFEIYRPLLPERIFKIPRHDVVHDCVTGETVAEYTERSVQDLEEAIIRIGPERVAAFVGETMPGTGGGFIPPAPGYWRRIREVCDRHDVHLILDEVFCGLGRAGTLHCCDADDVSPDFLCIGKTLGGAYAPLSAVLCYSGVEDVIASGKTRRIHHGHTFQGHALGAAAALAVQKIVHDPATLEHAQEMAGYLHGRLHEIAARTEYLTNLTGRGLLAAMDFGTCAPEDFGDRLQEILERDHRIQAHCTAGRLMILPAYIVTRAQIDELATALPHALEAAAQ